jgi:hypothetical protein
VCIATCVWGPWPFLVRVYPRRCTGCASIWGTPPLVADAHIIYTAMQCKPQWVGDERSPPGQQPSPPELQGRTPQPLLSPMLTSPLEAPWPLLLTFILLDTA